MDQLYYIVYSANIAKVNLDKATVFKLLTGFMAKEKGASGLSTILATAAIVPGATTKDLEPLASLVSKLVEQADEIDGKALFVISPLHQIISIFSLKEAPVQPPLL